MIDFRYHLVSIIAIFLALAVGLVVGATALAPKTEIILRKAQTELSKNNANLTKDKQALTNQVSADQSFAAAAAPRLLSGLLKGEKVVLVVAPGADGSVTTGVTAALRQAGAGITGTVNLSSNFLDTSGQNEATLTELAQSLAVKAGVTLPTRSASAVGGQQDAAQVLAATLLNPLGAAASGGNTQAILSAFSNFLSLASGTTLAPAQLAVLVTPGGTAPQPGSEVLVALALALRNAGSGTVMAGAVSSIGSGSVISAEDSAGQVSTVDNADTETGQIITVQALRLLLDGKAPKQYGIGPQSAPSPAPTPSPTASPSTSASTGGHK